MNEDLFAELVVSVKEGGSILRDEQKPSRKFHLDPVDIKRIRSEFNLTQVVVHPKNCTKLTDFKCAHQEQTGKTCPGRTGDGASKSRRKTPRSRAGSDPINRSIGLVVESPVF